MQVSLGRAEILVARQVLRHNRITGVFRGPRAELRATGVLDTLVSAPLSSQMAQAAPRPDPRPATN